MDYILGKLISFRKRFIIGVDGIISGNRCSNKLIHLLKKKIYINANSSRTKKTL